MEVSEDSGSDSRPIRVAASTALSRWYFPSLSALSGHAVVSHIRRPLAEIRRDWRCRNRQYLTLPDPQPVESQDEPETSPLYALVIYPGRDGVFRSLVTEPHRAGYTLPGSRDLRYVQSWRDHSLDRAGSDRSFAGPSESATVALP